jgi:hypothetical protein
MAAANGQYLMIARSAYDAVGGYAAVATSLLDDVTLARAVKASGRKIFFRFGADAVRTRMYRSFSQLREGWTKNLALLFPSPLQLAVLRLIEFVLIVGGVAIAVGAAQRGSAVSALTATLLAVVVYALFLNRIRKAHFAWDANAIALFGLPVFSYLLIRSQAANASGNVTWKGRTYGNGMIAANVTSPQPATPPAPTASKESQFVSSRRELGRET